MVEKNINIMWFVRKTFVIFFFSVCHASKPNIIFVVIDDLGWNDVSYHGSKEIPTPNLDALARSGVIISNYYTWPICTPSRASIMTAYYPTNTGTYHYVISAPEPWGLPLNFKLMPEYFKELGYDTHAIGKWHLGFHRKEYTPTYRGFDSHFGYWTGKIDHFDHTALEGFELGNKRTEYWGLDFHQNTTSEHGYIGKYSTNIFTSKANDVLKTHNKSKPLFLYLAYSAVHAGNSFQTLQAPRKYVDRFKHSIKDKKRQIFAGMVSAMDDALGDLVVSINDNGFVNNTILIVTTDNGGAVDGVDGSVGSNYPLRGGKYTPWEGGIRGTAFAWAPSFIKAPHTYTGLFHLIDWLPTLYVAAGHQELLQSFDPLWGIGAFRLGDWKVVYNHMGHNDWYQPLQENRISDEANISDVYETLRKKALVPKILKQHKIVERSEYFDRIKCLQMEQNYEANCQPDVTPCMYNIAKDPCELNNVAEVYPQILEKLWSRMFSMDYIGKLKPLANRINVDSANPALHNYEWTNFMDD